MEKKVKIILALFLVIGMIFIPIKSTNAYSGELNSKIRFPIMIFGGKGTISLSGSETGYTLYYQSVRVPDATFSQIEQMKNEQEKEKTKTEAELDAIDAELDNLKEIRDNAYDTFIEKRNAGITGDELETYKTAYDTAATNYQNKAKEYNDKAKDYNNKTAENKLKMQELIPTYNDNNWTKTDDGKFNIDLSQFTGKRTFAVWAKLVSSDGTSSYNASIYTMSGTQKEETTVNATGISLNKASLTMKTGDVDTLTATITPQNATNKTVVWSSDNEKVATVSNGKVTAKAAGTVTITAKTNDGKYTATCKITITNKVNNSDTKKDKPSNSDSKDQNKKDDTIAPGKMPQTGINMTMVFFIISSILISIIVYKKYNNYKDIK